MRVLVACEYSATVRNAFAAKGHYACEFTALKKEVEKLRLENFRMREVMMASYAPRAWKEE